LLALSFEFADLASMSGDFFALFAELLFERVVCLFQPGSLAGKR
jgi:hypothetical protein